MNRILFEKDEIVNGRVTFSDERAEHVLNVLHGAVGQVLKTGELDGLIGTSVITEIRDLHERAEGSAQRGSGLLAGTVVVECTHAEPSPQPWFELVLAPPRPRVLKRLLPQLTALGVGKIVLVGAEKVEKSFWGAQLLKPEIYRPLLVDGLMQCGTSRVPTIRCERNFRRYVEIQMENEFTGCEKIVAHPSTGNGERGMGNGERGMGNGERGMGNGERGMGNGGRGFFTPQPSVLNASVLAIGPEGGWTEDEVVLMESRGFIRRSLGSRILRTDTATIALVAQMMAERGI